MFHAEKEKLHRERVAYHGPGLETAVEHLEAFKTAAMAADDLLQRDKSAAPLPPEPEALSSASPPLGGGNPGRERLGRATTSVCRRWSAPSAAAIPNRLRYNEDRNHWAEATLKTIPQTRRSSKNRARKRDQLCQQLCARHSGILIVNRSCSS